MKKLLVMYFILFPTSAFSQQDTDAAPTTSIMDLAYAPPKGSHLLEIGYNKSNSSSDTQIQGNLFASAKSDSSSVLVGDTYGLTSRVQVGVAFLHSLSYTASDTYGVASTLDGTTKNYKRSGTYDPLVNLNFRLKDQQKGPFNLDFRVAYSPKVFPNKSPDVDHTGTVGRGGDRKIFGLRATKTIDDFQFGGFLTKTLTGSRTLETQVAGGTNTEASAYGELDIGFESLYRLEEFFVGVGYTINTTDSNDSKSGTSTINYDTTNSKTLSFVIKYSINETNGFYLGYSSTETDSTNAKLGAITLNLKNIVGSSTTFGYMLAF